MEAWRKLATQLFPERRSLYAGNEETAWSVLFDLHDAVVEAHRSNDTNQLEKIYKFAEWCHSQKGVEFELWKAAFAAFYEHLVEHEETYRAIPRWVKPEIFREMLSEYKGRLDNKHTDPDERLGTFSELLELYDRANGTSFAKGPH